MDLLDNLLANTLDLLAGLASFAPLLLLCFGVVLLVIRVVNFIKQVRRRWKRKRPVYYSVQTTPTLV